MQNLPKAILIIPFLVLLASAVTSAQTPFDRATPDCCLQAKDFQRQNQSLTARLQRAQSAYDSLSHASAHVLEQVDDRVATLTAEANRQLMVQRELRQDAERRISNARNLALDYASRGGFLGIGRRKQIRKISQALSN